MKLLKIFKIFLIVLSLISSPVYAENAVYLEKDKPAPFTGFLITEQKAKEYQLTDIKLTEVTALNESLKKSLVLQQDVINLTNKKADLAVSGMERLSKQLYDERGLTSYERLLWFGLGVVAVGIAVYGAKKLTQ